MRLAFLGELPVGGVGSPLRRDLNTHFKLSIPLSEDTPWLSWNRRRGRSKPIADANRYKLYISPSPEHIRESLTGCISLLADFSMSSLKFGSNAHGLLRPDKFIAYFDSKEELFCFAGALLPRLAGLSAHGVPFSAAIDNAGILSWGTDPTPRDKGVGWYVDDSWRIWICNRLAIALIEALETGGMEIVPWRFSLARLWLLGVDTRMWIPRTQSDGPPQ